MVVVVVGVVGVEVVKAFGTSRVVTFSTCERVFCARSYATHPYLPPSKRHDAVTAVLFAPPHDRNESRGVVAEEEEEG